MPRDTDSKESKEILSDLHLLKRQVQDAIDCWDYGNMRIMSPQEQDEHNAKYGKGSICIGRFVITKRF